MTAYYVSTPRFTIRVDVSPAGLILPTSARYLHRSYGHPWLVWLAALHRREGVRVRVVGL